MCCQAGNFFPAWLRCCGSWDFEIVDEKDEVVGKIENVYNGCGTEFLTFQDKFEIELPRKAESKDRILILNAVVYLNQFFFEFFWFYWYVYINFIMILKSITPHPSVRSRRTCSTLGRCSPVRHHHHLHPHHLFYFGPLPIWMSHLSWSIWLGAGVTGATAEFSTVPSQHRRRSPVLCISFGRWSNDFTFNFPLPSLCTHWYRKHQRGYNLYPYLAFQWGILHSLKFIF